MKSRKYYNEKLDCYITLTGPTQISFVVESQVIEVNTIPQKGTDFKEVASNEILEDSIAGMIVPYKTHVSFTGRLAGLGFVAADFIPV